MSAIWELPMLPTDKLVMLALADCANDEGHCWPSIATIARKSGASERSVQRAIRRAEEAGLLHREEVIGKGCKYNIDPRHCVTPVKVSPMSQCHPTPDTVSPKPSRTIKSSSVAKATSLRGSRIPADWQPGPLPAKVAALVALWPPGREEREIDAFRDYWTARLRDAARGNWDLTWHNRIRDQHDRIMRENGNGRTGNHKPSGWETAYTTVSGQTQPL